MPTWFCVGSDRCFFPGGLGAAGGAQILAGLLIDLPHAELDLAAVIEAEHLDLDLIAELYDVRDLPNPTMLTLLSLAPLAGAALFQLPLDVTLCAVAVSALAMMSARLQL